MNKLAVAYKVDQQILCCDCFLKYLKEDVKDPPKIAINTLIPKKVEWINRCDKCGKIFGSVDSQLAAEELCDILKRSSMQLVLHM